MEVKVIDSKKPAKSVKSEAESPLFDSAEELARLNRNLEKQNQTLQSMDWKLWVMMNAVVDYMIKTGHIDADNDPRQAK